MIKKNLKDFLDLLVSDQNVLGGIVIALSELDV
jgi:hypothetical protein